MPKINEVCTIQSQEQISPDIFLLRLKSKLIVHDCSPGQFVHIKINAGIDPLLRRPFSIHGIDRNAGIISLLYRVVGKGTQLMQEFNIGFELDVLGPLGQGFNLKKPFEHAIVVAGGLGSAPVFYLMDVLRQAGKSVTLFWGVKEACEIFDTESLHKLGVDITLATEDGSLGCQGFVTSPLNEFLDQYKHSSSTIGFVCGPEPMMQKVQEIALNTSFPWQASFERRMACGLGACMGCAVKMQSGDWKMACKHGPVFDLKEVSFEA